MAGYLPSTGNQIAMGRVYRAFTNNIPSTGYNISLRGSLGPYVGIYSGSIRLSANFGGRYYPYTY